MLGMQETLMFLVIFTLWVIRLYYKLYDKRNRVYVLIIGVLIVFWMVIRITKGLVVSNFCARFCWYLYYFPLIFVPSFFYMCVCSLICNVSRKNKFFVYGISSLLLCLVLSNDYHQLVFKFPNGVSDYDNYKHYIGYYVICFHIFYFFSKGMILLAIDHFKLKKHFKAFLPLILLVLGLFYTIFYVMNIPFFRGSNLSVILSTLICLGIELILYLGLIPNNSKYRKYFNSSSLNMMIVSLDGKSFYGTKVFNKVPRYIINDIKSDSVKSIYRERYLIYDVIFNKDSYVVFRRDISEFNRLRKIIKKRKKELLVINSNLKNKNEIKKELYEAKLRKDIVLKLENSMDVKKEEALAILDNDNLDEKMLEYIKVLISYCKRKSSLIISELNYDIYSSVEIRMLVLELFTDFRVCGDVIVNEMKISSYDMSIVYDIVFEVLKKCYGISVMLFICLDNGVKLRFILDRDIDVCTFDGVMLKKSVYGNDVEFVYSFERGKIL